MNYRAYKGKRLKFTDLNRKLQDKAIQSFWDIHLAYFYRRPGNIHSRINSNYIRKVASSLAYVKSLVNCPVARLKGFDANLVEFTDQGEYLNMYLELD